MAAALTRHLQELPWTADGLSLTQRLALQALRAGPQTVSALFRATQLDSEPLPFLGDLMPSCATCSVPFAIAPETAALPWLQHRLALTTAGEALLAGSGDWLAAHPPERWVGGVRIASAEAIWRWSSGDGKPVWT
jgi:hypothetical protein